MAQQLKGTGGQTFAVGSQLTDNNALGVRGSVIATMEAFNTEFANLKAINGYQKLPSGIIIQWGLSTSAAPYNTTLPIAFPNGVLSVFANARVSPAIPYFIGNTNTLLTFTIVDSTANVSITTSLSWGWLAIGY